MTHYEAVIGLEVHIHLKTVSKLFCGCSTKFGAPPNSQVCPVCLGLPGVLPVLNKKAVQYGVIAALSLNSKVNSSSVFSRKNYFYPDLPKAYQISQYDQPLSTGGCLDIFLDNKERKIGITRLHLEEDPGKLIHQENFVDKGSTLIDYNRCGVPLIEIVSEPEIRSPEEAYDYLTALKSILEYADVSDCNMEEGSLRCDANVSIRETGREELGTRTEIKNMNSLSGVKKAISFEIDRQIKVLKEGGRITQETRLWDEKKNITLSMRSKEEAHDYRYFPEPDLVRIKISDQWREELSGLVPELPEARKARLVKELGLSKYDAGVLTSQKSLADFYEECLKSYPKPKEISNWVMGELLSHLNKSGLTIEESKITPSKLTSLLKLISEGKISAKMAKEVFSEIFKTGEEPSLIIGRKGLSQISDEDALKEIIKGVIANNPKPAEEFRQGKEKTIGFLVGQVMRETKGFANPQLVNKLMRKELKSLFVSV